MIMKLLHGEYKMASIDVRNVLETSSSDCSSHLRSFRDNGFIEVTEEFDEMGSPEQFITPTNMGEQRYLAIYNFIQEFIESKTPFDFILNTKLKEPEK